MDAMELPGPQKMIAQIMSAVIEAVEERIRDGVNDPIVALYEEMNSNLDGTQYHPYDQPPTRGQHYD
jgi:hypothetical protein